MKKIVAGLLIATSFVALSACSKVETANGADGPAPTAVAAENNTTDAMAGGSNIVDSSGGEDNSAMAGNNATDSNATDPHGGSSGH